MTDSQDEMNRTLRFTTTPEERKIIRDRLNSFTNPLGKCSPLIVKSGGAMTYSNHKANLKRGAVGCNFITSSTNSTPNLKLNGGKTK